MAYGEKQVGFSINDGVNIVTQEMEYKGKCLLVEVRISEKYGFVQTVITDHATGDSVDLDMQLDAEAVDSPEVVLTSTDEEVGRIDRHGFKNAYLKGA